jgi:hypothetical protein
LNNNSNIQTLCNIINVDYPEHNIYGYENYDIFRKDDDVYQNAYESNSNLDVNDIYAIEMDNIDVTNFQLIRDFVIETQFISKLSQYFNLHYAIVSNDAYKKIASNYENNSINILQVFPKNNNIFYLLEFLKRATFFVVSDDIVGALIYTLQTKKTDGKHIINPKIKVYFDLNGHTYDHYKYYTTPKLASWDFCDFNLC